MNEVEELLNVSSEPAQAAEAIRPWHRIGLVLAAAVVVTLAMGGPAAVLMFPYFPLGLFRILGIDDAGMRGNDLIPAGWALYTVLGVGLMATSRRRAFFWLFVVLCVMLALNVAGCHMMRGEFGQGGI